MKKFTENKNQETYSSDQRLYKELYELVKESLTAKINGEDKSSLILIGLDDLVKELCKVVQNESITNNRRVLESFLKNKLQ